MAAENDYDKLNHGKRGTQWIKEGQGSDSVYEDLNLTQSNELQGVNVSCKRSEGKRLTPSSLIVAAVVAAAVIIIVLVSVTFVVVLRRTSRLEARLKSLPKSTALNNTRAIQELQMQMKALNKSCAIEKHHSLCTSSNDTSLTEVNGTNKAVLKPITSCSTLPKSSPSGYYRILSSNGSTTRVYCDMNKTCGNITGGWMKVTSLDMRQTSSRCPSTLCLNPIPRRTCVRCNVPGIVSLPLVTYHVGVSYSKVCGRLIAYQVGTPDAYSPYFSDGFDGIMLTYGTSEENIWNFIAALRENYTYPDRVCTCFNPEDHRILVPPPFIGNHYFCDTGAVVSIHSTFYSQDPLWDGQGCSGLNQCCSFNSPPWFYRELPRLVSNDIKLQINLDEASTNENIAIEKIDLYVQ